MSKLANKGLMPESAMHAIYWPVDTVCNGSPALQKLFDWYVDTVWQCGP